MKIAVFGCSWSHGQPQIENHYNWAWSIARKNPTWIVDNYSLAGSSLTFQVYLLKEILSHDAYDKIIFQFTTVGRLTFFDEDIDFMSHFKKYDENYSMFDINEGLYRKVIAITPGNLRLNKNDSFWYYPIDKYELANLYYKHINRSILKTEYAALVEFVKSKVDLCFFHNENTLNIPSIPVINDEITAVGGSSLLSSFIADDGNHFNKKGIEWEAEWVLNQLGDKK